MGAAFSTSRALQAPIVRFCLIGAVGFLVDAGLLMGFIHSFGLTALRARLGSFAGAVLVTFELNRRWTFPDARPASYLRSLAAYLGVQGFGFACNFAIYAGLDWLLRPAAAAPLLALAAASAAALALNYLGARLMVFRRTQAACTLGDKARSGPKPPAAASRSADRR